MEHQAGSQNIIINDQEGRQFQQDDDQDTFFDINNSFRLRKIRQNFTGKVLLITGIRVVSLFLTTLLFLLEPDLERGHRDIISTIGGLSLIVTFVCFVLSKKARTSSPLNCWLLVVNQLGANIIFVLNMSERFSDLPNTHSLIVIEGKGNPQTTCYIVVSKVAALLILDCLVMIAVVKFTNFDVKSIGRMLWQTLLAVFLAHGFAALLGGEFFWIVALISAPFCAFIFLIILLISRSIMRLGWCGPDDYVAASIYANDPLVYFISLCTEKRRTVGRQEQVYQIPANGRINTLPSAEPDFYPYKITEEKQLPA